MSTTALNALERDIAKAEEAFIRAKQAARVAGDGARIFVHIDICAPAKDAVDAIAAAWETGTRWEADGTQYVTKAGSAVSQAEAWYAPPQAAPAGAA